MAEFFKVMTQLTLGLIQGAGGFLEWLTKEIQFGTLRIAPWEILSWGSLYVIFVVLVIKLFI